MSVEVEEAQVTSASVEVDTLRVSDRQLTLSTFRQIEEEPVIDPVTHKIQGVVWGWVNYFPKGTEGDMHVVFQKDGKLKRDPLSKLRYNAEDAVKEYPLTDEDAPDNFVAIMMTRHFQDSSELRAPTNHPKDNIGAALWWLNDVMEGLDVGYYRGDPQHFYQCEAWRDFERAVNGYKEKLRSIKKEGQLYIAT